MQADLATQSGSQRIAGPSVLTAFPDSPRVIYTKNPLIEVICQLRYPAILKIDSAVPAGFQERVRALFPLFNEEDASSTEVPPELSQVIKLARVQSTRKAWNFVSEDGHWTISLTRDFAALSTAEYTRWEEFRARLELVCQALHEEYHPSFLNRAGLRYKDLILRSNLELVDAPWSDLLEKHLAPEYSTATIADAVREVVHQLLMEFPADKVKLGLRHGTARIQGNDEIAYLIDSDIYSDEKTEISHVLERLDLFNQTAGRLFRWCITQRLHDAMEPKAVL